MDAIDRAMTRSTGSNAETAVNSETQALWAALRADRQSRDERTERLRLMLLVTGHQRNV